MNHSLVFLHKHTHRCVTNNDVSQTEGRLTVLWDEAVVNGLVLLGKYTIKTTGLTYTLPGSTEAKSIIADNVVRIYDQSNPGKLIYAALDDMNANLAPLPFYVTPIETKDPDGVKLVGSSKPFPALAMSRQSEFAVVTK